MLSTTNLILAVLSGIIATIIMRIYDKFYNKQYEKKEYFTIGILSSISTLASILLYSILFSTHINISNDNTILEHRTQHGGNISSSNTNHNMGRDGILTKMSSVLNDNLDYFNPSNQAHNMRFNTGTPNF